MTVEAVLLICCHIKGRGHKITVEIFSDQVCFCFEVILIIFEDFSKNDLIPQFENFPVIQLTYLQAQSEKLTLTIL